MENVIEVNIKNYEHVLEEFSTNILSQSLADFIFNQYLVFPLGKKITIKFKSEEPLTEEEQKSLVYMIRSYYGFELKKLHFYMKDNLFRQTLLFLIGTIIIMFANFSGLNDSNTIKEILIIIGWVFVSECILNFVFNDSKRKFKMKKYKALTEAKIEFE